MKEKDEQEYLKSTAQLSAVYNKNELLQFCSVMMAYYIF